MAAVTEEYKTKVMDDVKTYVGLARPIKASLIERLAVRKLSPKRLHPNPEDEFSMPEIGPNYEIVGKYEKTFKNNMDHSQDAMDPDDPLMIEKMSTGGYMLLNGHHRWMAALRLGLKRVPVQIVNTTTIEDIISAIKKSNRDMCVSFDLDEVLFIADNNSSLGNKLSFPFNLIFKHSLKKNAQALINELRFMGFDVWVYTGNYYSDKYINSMFSLFHTGVDGIVNALNEKSRHKNLKDLFTQNYRWSVHIDNESVLCVNTKTHEYESYELNTDGADWAADVIAVLKKLDFSANEE